MSPPAPPPIDGPRSASPPLGPTLLRFLPYLWPKDRPALRLRVVAAMLLVLMSKAIAGLAMLSGLPGRDSGADFAEPPMLAFHAAPLPPAGAAAQAAARLQAALAGYHTLQVSLSASPPPDYRLDIAAADPAGTGLRATLTRGGNGELLWQKELGLAADPALATDALAAAVAGERGLIVADMRSRTGDSFAPGYPCSLKFYELRLTRARSDDLGDRVRDCLERSVALRPNDAPLLADLSFVRLAEAPPGEDGAADRAEARRLAERALLAGPQNGYAHKALARVYFHEGNCARGRVSMARAAELAPADPMVLLYGGAFLIGCGDAGGRTMLERSIALDPDGSGQAVATLAFADVRDGNPDGALARLRASRAAVNPRLQFEFVRALAAIRKGDPATARAKWLAIAREVDRDPDEVTGVVARFTTIPMIAEQAAAMFATIGIGKSGQGA